MFNKNAFKQKDPVAEAIKNIAEQDYKLKLEALKGDQTKLDKNKNNKLDADDFKILRKEKKVEEATSPFDWKNRKSELPSKPGEKTGHDSKKTSTGTVYTKRPPKKDPEEIKEMVHAILEKPLDEDLKSVAKKVGSVAKKVGSKVLDTLGHKDDDEMRKDFQRKLGAKGKQVHGMKSMAKYNEEVEQIDERELSSGEKTEREKNVKGMKKNLAGFKARYGKRAKDVMYATATKMAKEEFDLEDIDPALVEEFMQTEEFEQLDELSKKTLASYAKKATDDVSYHSFTAGTRSSKDPQRMKDDQKAMTRQSGVNKAVDRLAKEDVEQIDELKKSTLASYTNKAALDVHNNAFRAGGKMSSGDVKGMKDNMVKSLKRQIGISKAAKKLAKD